MKRVALGFAGNLSIQEMLPHVKTAEEKGYESIWMAEDHFLRDGISPLTAFAAATERIKLATGIICPYTRHAVTVAMSIATVDEYSNGRAILGLGSSVREMLEDRMGVRYDKHLARMREYVDVIRRLFAGETVTYQGKTVNIRNVQLGFRPNRDRISVYVGGTGPRMLELAGEIGDGVFLNAFCSPQYTKFALEQIEKGAERSGRSLKDLDISAYIVFSADHDAKRAKEAPRKLLALYFSYANVAGPLLQHSGLASELQHATTIRDAVAKGDLDGASRILRDSTVETVTASGTPDECRARLREYVDAGAKLPVILSVGPDLELAVETAARF
ncbi:MAG: LLM class flavin-dependent oxidoreductase [Candidatus Bathyarchaeia archaeon]